VFVVEDDDQDDDGRNARSVKPRNAILDVNIEGKFITPVAEKIAARGLPIIFATGYGSIGLPKNFAAMQLCQSRSTC
jgi:hypothetical protein